MLPGRNWIVYDPLNVCVGKLIRNTRDASDAGVPAGSAVTVNGPVIVPDGPVIDWTSAAVKLLARMLRSKVRSIALLALFRTRFCGL